MKRRFFLKLAGLLPFVGLGSLVKAESTVIESDEYLFYPLWSFIEGKPMLNPDITGWAVKRFFSGGPEQVIIYGKGCQLQPLPWYKAKYYVRAYEGNEYKVTSIFIPKLNKTLAWKI